MRRVPVQRDIEQVAEVRALRRRGQRGHGTRYPDGLNGHKSTPYCARTVVTNRLSAALRLAPDSRVRAGQRRDDPLEADDLAQALYALREATPTGEARPGTGTCRALTDTGGKPRRVLATRGQAR